jgi:hypothetical protein
MDVSRPYGLIAHPLDSAVLHVLAGATGGLTGRTVARLAAEGSQQGIAKALGRLADEGVVKEERAGSSILYSLNRRHLAAEPIEGLVNLREGLLDRMTEAIGEWEIPPVHASLFGSAARADGDSSSDIDLLIVRPHGVGQSDGRWQAQVERLTESVPAWTGNRASVVDLSEDDLPKLERRNPTLLANLEADAIDLFGADTETIFGSGAR